MTLTTPHSAAAVLVLALLISSPALAASQEPQPSFTDEVVPFSQYDLGRGLQSIGQFSISGGDGTAHTVGDTFTVAVNSVNDADSPEAYSNDPCYGKGGVDHATGAAPHGYDRGTLQVVARGADDVDGGQYSEIDGLWGYVGGVAGRQYPVKLRAVGSGETTVTFGVTCNDGSEAVVEPDPITVEAEQPSDTVPGPTTSEPDSSDASRLDRDGRSPLCAD